RRAMGKKKPEEMAKQRSVFAEGAEKNGINAELAMKSSTWWRNSLVTDLTNRTLRPMLWCHIKRYG
ncbi:hypothetical protein NE652_10405, partial [Bifidobacterium pseudocatenulatum]|nr:hypothetical protein [Bifidobacterium pseudocatenulatum]